MKKTLLILAAVALSFSTALAQDKTLTSNSSQTVTQGTVQCTTSEYEGGPSISSSENAFLKQFNLADLGVEDDFHIQSFQFGVSEAVTGAGTEVIVMAELWKTKATDFPATWGSADYVNIATEAVSLNSTDDKTIVTVNFDDPITVEEDDFIIAKVWNESMDEGYFFFIGANLEGDSEVSYLVSEPCGANTPTPLADLGADTEAHIVMNLKGVEGTLGVQDFVNADLTLYPNPASDQFNISSGNEVIQSVIVRDILGKTIETIQVNALNQDVNVSNLPKGLYLVEVELETGRAVQKLIKK